MVDFTIKLSPLKPTTLEIGSFSSNDSGDYVITLAPIGYTGTNDILRIDMGILGEDLFPDEKIYEAFFNPGSPYIEWERAYDEIGTYGGTTKNFKSAIDIFYKNPTNGKIEVSPYWQSTKLQYMNPDNDEPFGDILTNFWAPVVLGNLDEEDEWNKQLEQDDSYRKYDPTIQPGEYLIVKHVLHIDGHSFNRIFICEYESPLFTGGKLISKEGEGVDVTYTVEIFGQIVSGIKPTDHYADYSIGKWVYLLKSVSLEGGKQEYGSSDISAVAGGDFYRLTPYNFSVLWGPDCAIDYTKAINISGWEEMFDKVQMGGTITDIDYETDTADVDIPGASEHTLPIFYYCQESDSIVGGSAAFAVGDNVLVCKKENTWSGAKIIGFPSELKLCDDVRPCAYILLKHDSEEEGAPDRYWYVVWDVLNNAFADITWEHDGTGYHFNSWPIYDPIIETWWSEEKAKYSAFTTSLEFSAWQYALGEYEDDDYDTHIQWFYYEIDPYTETYVGSPLTTFEDIPSGGYNIINDSKVSVDCEAWCGPSDPWDECYHIHREHTRVLQKKERSGPLLGKKTYGGEYYYYNYEYVYEDRWPYDSYICEVIDKTETVTGSYNDYIYSIDPSPKTIRGLTPHFITYYTYADAENWYRPGGTYPDYGDYTYQGNDWDIKFHISPLHGYNENPKTDLGILPSDVPEKSQITSLLLTRGEQKDVANDSYMFYGYKRLTIDAFSYMNDEPIE